MRTFLAFLAIGSLFATVEEFLTVLVIRHDLASYLFTLFILFPVFLTFVWSSSRLLNLLIRGQAAQELAHFFTYGLVGLLIEWFLMGLAPWSNPNAHPAIMCIFQLGMFSFWATVAFAPRLFTNAQELSRKTGRAILKFYVPYFVLVYLISFLVPEQMRFVTVVSLVVFGYLTLNLFYLQYFRRLFSQSTTIHA